MDTCKRFLVLLLSVALGLATPLPSVGRQRPFDLPAHRADPCDHLSDPVGLASGHDRHCPPRGSSSGIAKGDFNGDGFGDLAIGVPDEDVNTISSGGAVNIIYGSVNGLTSGGTATVPLNQQLTQNTVGENIEDAEANDRFGASLASGDFNGDGASDLAIGVPGEQHAGSVGAVEVFYGVKATGADPGGLGGANLQIFYASDFGQGSGLGNSLAWGDFDGDAVGDLAIGGGGFVLVLSGDANTGLTTAGFQVQILPATTPAVTLAAGDFNGDGRSDLAVGTPVEDILDQFGNPVTGAGVVRVFPGSSNGGVDFTTVQVWTQFNLDSSDGAQSDDFFGSGLAAGDFNCDTRSDLAIGVPGENLVDAVGNSLADAGAVDVIYESVNGLTATGNQFFNQAKSGMAGKAEAGDQFGAALAASDFDANGCKDLAIGVPFEDFDDATPFVKDSGAVNVVYGFSGSGLRAGGSQFFHQNTPGMPDEAEQSDRFGTALTAWDFNGDGAAELVIGVPNEDVVNTSGVELVDAGQVHVLNGVPRVVSCCPLSVVPGGLTLANTRIWHQDSPGINGSLEQGDHFGLAVY